ncbi:hypothetical protein ElyMa_004056800 [Elysia marginata]|uniref:Uncharacterized protein n=1 Tax=Elysia marginata TaxID=1093978 RepID=A0AAV4G585_9GAST|nr:hypothetical protein ElyMa_004056800 [Elysia marginata]
MFMIKHLAMLMTTLVWTTIIHRTSRRVLKQALLQGMTLLSLFNTKHQDRTFERHVDRSGMMQTHSSDEETDNTVTVLNCLARALETGDTGNSYEDTTLNESFIGQSPDAYLLRTSTTSSPHKSPTGSFIVFFSN